MALLTTNVPTPVFGPTGFIIPSDSAILAGVQADINAAFGGNLNPSLSSPQGQLATTMAAITANADQTFLYYTQQVDPAYATGRMQDAIARIYFLERNPAEPTVVTCTCTGLTGTVIEGGALAQDTAGNLYQTLDGGTIGESGTVSIDFSNTQPGPIPCPAGTLTIIYQTVPGWDTITNPADGALGTVTETRAAFEARRAASVAGNSRGTIQAIQGAVQAVPGVLDSVCYQNDTASPITWRNVAISAHSIYVAVVGGDDDAVAQAIWSKKSPGCAYNGNTTVTVYDTSPNYTEPYPAYAVTFTRPSSLPIYFDVQIANNPLVPSDADTQIQAAIIAAFAGADGGPRAQIASTIFASRFYAPVAALGPWVQILSITIGSTNAPNATVTGTIATTVLTVTAVASGLLAPEQVIAGIGITEGTSIVNQLTGVNAAVVTASISGTTMTVTGITSGVLAANQVIHGTGVAGGTTILSQLTGSAGSTGTYRVSLAQTVTSTSISADTPGTTGTYTVSNSQTVSTPTTISGLNVADNSVTVNADQEPVISAVDIVVGIN
jgi:Baseplate J-like protein